MTQRDISVERAKAQVEGAKAQAKQATRQASPWIEPLGRLGYAAKGVVYGLVGVLAAMAAAGRGGETTDSRGALVQIAQAPFGKALLAVLTVGLVGYGIWRIVQGFLDTDNKGSDAKGRVTRLAYAGIGVVYLGLAVSAVRLIQGADSGGNTQQSLIARLLQQPFGQWLVGLVGLVVIGVGGYQIYKAYSKKFHERLRLGEMSPTEQRWATRAGELGFTARGIVFVIVGILIVVAALRSNASEATGIGGALQTLQGQPYGPWLLGVVAIGLVAYGFFCLVEARYRRMFLS